MKLALVTGASSGLGREFVRQLDGEKDLDEMALEIFEALIAAASGRPTKSEQFGMGGDEFIVWWLGITA